jgi:hypothetical protein
VDTHPSDHAINFCLVHTNIQTAVDSTPPDTDLSPTIDIETFIHLGQHHHHVMAQRIHDLSSATGSLHTYERLPLSI